MAAYLQFVEQQQQEYSDFCKQLLFRKLTHLLLFTGSCFELPVIYSVENITDVDAMRYPRNICAVTNEATAPKDFKGTLLIIQCERSYPGYARLYYKNNHLPYTYALVPEDRPAFSRVVLEKSEIIRGLLFDSSNTMKWLAAFHGLSYDTVDAIWCPNWPEEAHEWITRERRNEWPLLSTVDKIVNKGCFLVAKPYQRSHVIASEWRFSFSEAELLLIHTWSDVQMYVYHILRLIKDDVVRKCGGKKMTFVTTYHFKTLMFWACEEKLKDFWLPANIESSVKELILVMIEWLIKKKCRNYFIPGNNMLSHLPDSHNFEKEVQFLINSENSVEQYISNTVPFTVDHKNHRLKEFPVRVPTNLLFAAHLRVALCNIVDVPRPGRQIYVLSNAIEKSHLFRSDSYNLFQCLTIHMCLMSSEDLEHKMSLFRDAEECFKRANEKQVDDFTHGYISPMDNIHTILAKMVNKTIDWSDSIALSDSRDQHVESIPLFGNSTRWELCYSRTTNHVACVLEMFVNFANDKLLKPSCFQTAAYEANFYWTIFEKEGKAENYKKAMAICKKWLSHAMTILNSISFTMFFSTLSLPIIVSNRWSMIFDKYIQVVLGFLSLVKASTKSRLQSENNDYEVLVQVCPIDLLGYIRYRCQSRLGQYSFFEYDSFTDEMQNDVSRMFLYTAARISNEIC